MATVVTYGRSLCQPLEGPVEKAINRAMMLVSLHLINAGNSRPLLKCHIYLLSH